MPVLRLTAIVRPSRAEALCQRLLESGVIDELTIAEVRGYGRQKGHLESYQAESLDVLPKVLVSGMVDSEQADTVIDLILTHARTGRIGDGKIFLERIDGVVECPP